VDNEAVDAAVSRNLAPSSGTRIAQMTFTRRSLGQVCTLVRASAEGIEARDVDDLLIAVSEVATNAICYAGGAGSIALWDLTGGLLAEVTDNGPGLPDTMVIGRPPPDSIDGRGLWLARVLVKEFEILNGPQGLTVRMFTPYKTKPVQPVLEVPHRAAVAK
jgi:serine/threonine-protein kinase RsbW